jgi:hypothetical protein
MKKLLWLGLLLVSAAPNVFADGALALGFTSVAAGVGIPNIGTGIGYHKITWNVSGTVATCTVALDTSVDNVNWSAGGAITGQTCTSNGASSTVNVVANYVRINVTVFSGTGSVNVTWNGYVNNSSVFNSASPGPIGGTTPNTGAFSSLSCGVLNTTGCVITGYGGTSGSATMTWPGVAGTATNPILISNSVQLPSGTVRSWNGDTGLSRDSAAVIDIGNGTAADKSGTLNAASLTATTQIQLVGSVGNINLLAGGNEIDLTRGGLNYIRSTTAAGQTLFTVNGVAAGSPTLTLNSTGALIGATGRSDVLTLIGLTSGSVSIAPPAVGGTTTNPITISNSLQLPSGTVYNWNADTGLSRDAAAIVDVGNGTAGNNSAFIRTGNTVQVAANFTTASTSLVTITGLAWTFPATAHNYSFHCSLSYSQATAAAIDAFGVQAATTAPTNLYAAMNVNIGATLTNGVDATLPILATTTATNIGTFTPSLFGAIGTIADIFSAELWGTLQQGAGATTLNIMALTGSAADSITIYQGSFCELTP